MSHSFSRKTVSQRGLYIENRLYKIQKLKYQSRLLCATPMTLTLSAHRAVLAENVDPSLVLSSIMLRQISAYFQNTNKFRNVKLFLLI